MQKKIIDAHKKANPPKKGITKFYKSLAEKFGVTFSQVKDLVEGVSYNSKIKKQLRDNSNIVLNEYNKLNDEQKKNPIKPIMDKTSLSRDIVCDNLIRAGLYERKKRTKNQSINIIKSNPKEDKNKKILQKRKRGEDDEDRSFKKKKEE